MQYIRWQLERAVPVSQRWDIDEEEEIKLQIKCHYYRVSEEKDHLVNDWMTKVNVEQPRLHPVC